MLKRRFYNLTTSILLDMASEVTEVVGQHEQGQPHLVGDEARAREARPGESVLALLDPLLAIAPLVVKICPLTVPELVEDEIEMEAKART